MPSTVLRGGRAAISFRVFDAHHHRLWLRYAHTQAGGARAAGVIVDATRARLAADWAHVREQPSVSGHAWALLRQEVAGWLDRHEREPVIAGTAAFRAALRGLLLYETRDAFTVLEGGIGLYGAIAALPERQYDVVVLRYVLRAPDEDVAAYLGIELSTVRSHVRHARRRLARMLDIPETA
ncbi:RNA polymerase sigma factor [Streptomyces sp. NBC_01497]|uniref:RNA polymerase sigma factor n=1 Tax=Streptomyces sp. NBC_01497 TaxID=2903885 RepID=UPI002E346384|nr:sigma factor-like helix-turn-helix DNA-binding protein [Streptomyces sp. NBC_01497]